MDNAYTKPENEVIVLREEVLELGAYIEGSIKKLVPS